MLCLPALGFSLNAQMGATGFQSQKRNWDNLPARPHASLVQSYMMLMAVMSCLHPRLTLIYQRSRPALQQRSPRVHSSGSRRHLSKHDKI